MSIRENGVSSPETNVLTIDLASIKAYDKLMLIDTSMLSNEESDNTKALIEYIRESGIEQEINFSDERLIKTWYALNMKIPSPIFTTLVEDVENWVLLQEYMRSFTPADGNYDVLMTVLQSSIVYHFGFSDIFENKVELNDADFLAYQTGISVIWNTETWDRLPDWYQEILKLDAPNSYLTASEAKLKELYELLKAA
jgi:hypothetical protein